MLPTIAPMIVVGLTGSIGMGKSTVASHFQRLGFSVYDSDAAVHQLYSRGGAAVEGVERLFPEAVVSGRVDRRVLASLVSNPNGGQLVLQQLEALIHPLVAAEQKRFREEAEARGEWLVVEDVPLLYESQGDKKNGVEYGSVVVCSCDLEEQTRRCLERPGMTLAKLDTIRSRQLPDEEKRRRADFVIDTNHPFSTTPARAQVAAIIDSLRTSSEEAEGAWESWRDRDCLMSLPPEGASNQKSSLPERELSGRRRTRLQPQKPAPTVVTLDIDDTLCETFPPIHLANEWLLGAMRSYLAGLTSEREEEEEEGNDGMQASLRSIMGEVKLREPGLAHDLTALRHTAIQEWFQARGLSLSDAAAGASSLMPLFIKERSRLAPHLYSDTLPALQALKDRGMVIGALTNGNADVFLDPVLAPYFDFAVSAVDAGASKPSIAPFLAAARAAGDVPPSRFVHVGDDLSTDVAGALGAGMRAVYLNRTAMVQTDDVAAHGTSQPRQDNEDEGGGTQQPRADATIASLCELGLLVDTWCSGVA